MDSEKKLVYQGAKCLRQVIMLSLLSGRQVTIENIRSDLEDPGLQPFEVSLLHLAELISNGSLIDINVTGTRVKFSPGIITNGSGLDLDFECEISRSIPYYLEFLLPLVILGKEPISIALRGVTNDNIDVSIDTIRATYVQFLSKFGLEGGSIEINK